MPMFNPNAIVLATFAVALSLGGIDRASAAEPTRPTTVKFRVTGLFIPERIADFRAAMLDYPDVKLLDVDFDTNEASFLFDPKIAFPGTRPMQIAERFDLLLRRQTRGAFGIRPLCEVPREQLKFIEIPIIGLDCQACSLGAYDAIARLEGVEQATASFHDGLVTAWIDTAKTTQAEIEATLVKRRVTLKKP